jgi:hypothetical protein
MIVVILSILIIDTKLAFASGIGLEFLEEAEARRMMIRGELQDMLH